VTRLAAGLVGFCWAVMCLYCTHGWPWQRDRILRGRPEVTPFYAVRLLRERLSGSDRPAGQLETPCRACGPVDVLETPDNPDRSIERSPGS
jgi:hypothetical protein